MGKTRKHKIRFANKPNPLGIPQTGNDEDDFFDSEEGALGPVEAVRDQLLNANVEEKLNGLQSLAVLTSNKEKVAAICRSDLIRVAGPLLCERDQSVRNAAAGALRNLSVSGPEVCEFMVDQDVLTPLLVLLGEYTRDTQWTPTFDDSMGGQLDLRSDVFLQGVNLLWNLCESTAVALDTFNHAQLLEGMIRCLDVKVFGLDIAISVAQCLLVVSEANPKSWNVLNQHVPELLYLLGQMDTATELEQAGHSYLRTLSAGILSNVPALAAAYAVPILNALGEALKQSTRQALNNITSSFPAGQECNGSAPELEVKMDTTDDETEQAAALRRRRQELPTESDIAVRNVEYLLDAQRVAAEVITNLVSADEEEWIDEEDECVSESESIVDCDTTISNSNSVTNLSNGDKLPVEVVEVLKSIGLTEKLWQRTLPLPDNVAQLLLESNIGLLMKAKNLRISSLLCLQNLFNVLNAEDLGGHNAIYNVWVDLGQQVFKGPQDPSVLEPATSLMRSALEHLKSNKNLFTQMSENDLELMLNGVKGCTMAEIRANWLRMLGSLGCLLPEALVKIIIRFIIETCAKEEDVWTISEALDALMDMFSDNDWNQIALDLNLPESIKELEKIFKTKIRQQRRELKERYPAVQTVRTNLSRFVKYIEKETEKYATANSAN